METYISQLEVSKRGTFLEWSRTFFDKIIGKLIEAHGTLITRSMLPN